MHFGTSQSSPPQTSALQLTVTPPLRFGELYSESASVPEEHPNAGTTMDGTPTQCAIDITHEDTNSLSDIRDRLYESEVQLPTMSSSFLKHTNSSPDAHGATSYSNVAFAVSGLSAHTSYTAHSNLSAECATASGASACSSPSSICLSLNTTYNGPLIPPTSDEAHGLGRRTLVLCFDGTGDEFDEDNSNVVKFFSLLKKGDGARQMCYYQSGIGTYTVRQMASPTLKVVEKTLDLTVARNLKHHVMIGYKFLMQNYKDGDKICIFGFSRGAYIARALAGMIHKVGLLPNGNEQQLPFAYRMYSRDDEMGWKQSVLFKRTFSINVPIEFVGVWDTVASVGLLPYTLPFTQSNTAIHTFRHAVALDERRVKFKPSLYREMDKEEVERRDSMGLGDSPISPACLGVAGMSKGDILGKPREEGAKTERRRSVLKKHHASATVVLSESSSTSEHRRAVSLSATRPHVPPDAISNGNSDPDAKIRRSRSLQKRRVSADATTFSSAATERGSGVRSSSSLVRRSVEAKTLLKDMVRRAMERGIGSDEDGSGEDLEKLEKEEKEKEEKLDKQEERERLEAMYLDTSRPTDVEEVWFAGCHCDIGGGSVANDTPHSLARIPLRWMIRECFRTHSGIQFEAEKLREIGLAPESLYPIVLNTAPMRAELGLPPADADPSATATDGESKGGAEGGKRHSGNGHHRSVSYRKVFKTLSIRRKRIADTCASDTLVEKRTLTSASVAEEVVTERDSVRAEADVEKVRITVEVVSPVDGLGSRAGSNSMLAFVPTTSTANECPSSRAGSFDDDADLTSTLAVEPVRVAAHKVPRGHVLAAEAEAERQDALSPIYDQLEMTKAWWALEVMPWNDRVLQGNGSWKKVWAINVGKPRVVPQQPDKPLKVHRSVLLRMNARGLNYTPRVKFDVPPLWVD